MKLQFFSRKFVERLRHSAGSNLGRYGSDPGWIDAFAGSEVHIHESAIVLSPPPVLLSSPDGDNVRHDAENSRRVYDWLSPLTPALAMEERLWAYLTHCTFAKYMSERWPAETETLVQRRYLFEGQSFAALSRNGIARLWWAAHLTKDNSRPDAFELTDVLFLRQDIQVSLLERSIGKCRGVRISVLEFLRDNQSWLATKSFTRRIQVLLRELNLLGGVALLDTLPPAEIASFLDRVGQSLVAQEESTSAADA